MQQLGILVLHFATLTGLRCIVMALTSVGKCVQVQLPYLAEENHDEDPEVQVKPESDTAAARSAKDAIYNNKAKVSFRECGPVRLTRFCCLVQQQDSGDCAFSDACSANAPYLHFARCPGNLSEDPDVCGRLPCG